MIKDKKSLKASTPSRRKFFKAAAATGAAAATAVAMPNIATADGHVTLKMQAAWPSGANIFFEMAQDYCNIPIMDGCLQLRSAIIFMRRRPMRSKTHVTRVLCAVLCPHPQHDQCS